MLTRTSKNVGLTFLAILLMSCGPTPKGWQRDEAAVAECSEAAKDSALSCKQCCETADAAGHVWTKGQTCECL